MGETADADRRSVSRVIDRDMDVSSDDKKSQHYGPLTGDEWLELDHWAFQELPRHAYDLFKKIVQSHNVPIERWQNGDETDTRDD